MMQKGLFPPARDVKVSLALTIAFGPLGLLYSNAKAAAGMMVISAVILLSKRPEVIPIVWPASCAMGVWATKDYNRRLAEKIDSVING
jgi:hypothetical protein